MSDSDLMTELLQVMSAMIAQHDKELATLRLEVKKYEPMLLEWKRNKDKRNGFNVTYKEYEK